MTEETYDMVDAEVAASDPVVVDDPFASIPQDNVEIAASDPVVDDDPFASISQDNVEIAPPAIEDPFASISQSNADVVPETVPVVAPVAPSPVPQVEAVSRNY